MVCDIVQNNLEFSIALLTIDLSFLISEYDFSDVVYWNDVFVVIILVVF